MKTKMLTALLILLLVVGVNGGASAEYEIHRVQPAPLQAPVGTVFTYQGILEDQGGLANGLYDFQFILHDHATNTSPVGSTQINDDVVVVEGVFMVELDFGSVFDGTALWLQIGVRTGASSGAYTDLSPRQPLNPVPYAIHADKLDGYDANIITNYLSIPAAGFNSTQYNGEWDIIGDVVIVWDSSGTPFVRAPVYLPHGSEIQKVTFFWDDTDSGNNGTATLRRVTMSDASSDAMASMSTSGSGGKDNSYEDSVVYSSIDNSQYSYYLISNLPSSQVRLISILIEYTDVGLY